MLSNIQHFTQPAQCMLLFLVLAGNSTLLRFFCSYTLEIPPCCDFYILTHSTLFARSYVLLSLLVSSALCMLGRKTSSLNEGCHELCTWLLGGQDIIPSS